MSHGGAGRARSQLKKRGAWSQEWARGHGAMGPWGYGAMSHEREGREGRRGQACAGALLWDHGQGGKSGGGGRALGPFKVSLSREGRGARDHTIGPWGQGRKGPSS